MSQQSVYSNRCMAWYNATGKENDKFTKELENKIYTEIKKYY